MFLNAQEKSAFKTTKVAHNGLLADRIPVGHRPVRSDLEHGWPAAVRDQVLPRWQTYGYRAA